MADRDPGRVSAEVDWREVARLVLTSREMDRIEEQELVPARKVLYQFSARGHDMAQVLLGLQLRDGDGAFGYYRSRPLLLALGVPLADALGSGMGLAGTLFPGVLWAQAQAQSATKITKEMIDNAAAIADVPIADEYKEMMLEDLNDHAKGYEEIYKLKIPNSVDPALVFDPVLPGMKFETERKPMRMSRRTLRLGSG